MNIFIIVFGVLLLVAFAGAHYIQYKPIVKSSSLVLTVIVSVVIISLTIANIYKFLLNKKYRDNDSLERIISKKLSEF